MVVLDLVDLFRAALIVDTAFGAEDDQVVEFALSRSLSPAIIAQYELHLPDKKMLEAKLRELSEVAELEVVEDQAAR